MDRKRSLFFLIPAVLLGLVLCYSVVQALRIYIPQQRELRAFAELKERALSSAVVTAAPAPAPVVEEDRALPEAAAEPEPETPPPASPYPYALLSEQNADFVGWLSVPDTQIDYPVMKSSEDDPQYYIHRDFSGNAASAGCLFIGGGCDADSESFIIYGHNMNNGSMFGRLDEYADYAYAVSHPDLHLSMPDGERVYRVFAAFQTRIYAERDDVFKYYEQIGELGEAEYEETVTHVRAMSLPSLPYAPSYPAQLLFLSTCSYHTENGRFVVAAYRVDEPTK